ncbi:MAG: glycosyltransferase involved in cell wall biosynthesis [Parvicellaceae bacterium]|jgi:glycosyltransferase involved in cell wall biosynthesis
MKILQLCNKPPLPAVDGGCIAMNNITQGLLEASHEVRIISISTHKHPFKQSTYDPNYIRKTNFEAVYVETKVNIVDAFSSLVTSDNYNISRFFSTDFDRKLMDILKREKFDIVHLESLFMAPYIATIRRFSNAKVILRSHNLEFMIWQRSAESAGNRAKRVYLNYLAKQLKQYEINVIADVDGIAAISNSDAEKYASFGCKKPLKTIPFGIDVENYCPTELSQNNDDSIFHIGAMDWKPNVEGVMWFAEKVFPNLKGVNLHLAGRKMPKWFSESLDKGIHNHGEVIDALTFMDQFPIMIVPLFSAGGMRVKIIEGMAMKKAVISTTVGAEGINAKHGENIMIADTKEEFAAAINALSTDIELRYRIQENGRKLVDQEYSNTVLTERLVQFYDEVLLQ